MSFEYIETVEQINYTITGATDEAYPTWNAFDVYSKSQKVKYSNKIYQARQTMSLPTYYVYNKSEKSLHIPSIAVFMASATFKPLSEFENRYIYLDDRDTLYNGKVNPIASFPGQGVVVYGQKTLQTRASALDRVNVRRLLIALKNYISQVANNLVFEQNTAATRNNFLAQVNPYLESVQQRQGLYVFQVIMDDTNNTPKLASFINAPLRIHSLTTSPTGPKTSNTKSFL